MHAQSIAHTVHSSHGQACLVQVDNQAQQSRTISRNDKHEVHCMCVCVCSSVLSSAGA